MALQTATFGGGCFWCIEAAFQEIDGVVSLESGYSGGQIERPTYEQICQGTTGHAEVVKVTFDSDQLSYETLLELFFTVHDPTTLNRQGADRGTQYRSVIFYHDDTQKSSAESYIKTLEENNFYGAPIVTEVSSAPPFYGAEKYHQNYYRQNPNQPYCQVVITPKVQKIRDKLNSFTK